LDEKVRQEEAQVPLGRTDMTEIAQKRSGRSRNCTEKIWEEQKFHTKVRS
jgi:hypothetical protein